MEVSSAQTKPRSDRQNSSPMQRAAMGAAIASATTGVLIAGDKYFPGATRKAVYLLNFAKPPKDKAVPLLNKVSTKAKFIGVAAIAAVSALIGAFSKPPEKV